MHISTLKLVSSDIKRKREFFGTILNVPILVDNDEELIIVIGSSQLNFKQGEVDGHYHYAFDIPENQFEQAVTWLEARLTPLYDRNGQSVFYHDNINGYAVYFKDGNGNIVEFVARYHHQTNNSTPFTQNNLIRICEIGLATPDVQKTVERLQTQGLNIVTGEGSKTFTMVGSELGVMIIVKEGRHWMPTNNIPAPIIPTELTMQGIHQSISFDGLPYTVHPTQEAWASNLNN